MRAQSAFAIWLMPLVLGALLPGAGGYARDGAPTTATVDAATSGVARPPLEIFGTDMAAFPKR